MIFLTDNDILKKLAICDLLDAAVVALDASHEEILVLPTARFQLGVAKNPDKARAALGARAFDRLCAFLGKVREIHVSPSPEEQRLFDDAMDIDPGEAILFSASLHFPGCAMVTGDKRCLRALVSLADAGPIVARLAGKVICFEQLVLRILNRAGFECVRDRVAPVCQCDQVLRVAFGSGVAATEESVRRSLTVYADYLRRETGSLLVEW